MDMECEQEKESLGGKMRKMRQCSDPNGIVQVEILEMQGWSGNVEK